MNLTLLWKEWREQRLILATISAFAALAIVFAAQVFDASSGGNALGPREYVPFGLACLAGIVCGAILLADEKEVGTLEFLDTLPTYRWRLWISKCVFGLVMATGMGLIFALLSVALKCIPSQFPPLAFAAAMTFVSIASFSWGLFGGAVAKTTLGAIVQGVVYGFIIFVIAAVLIGAVAGTLFGNMIRDFSILVTQILVWLGIGFVGSLWIFSRPDRRTESPLGEDALPRVLANNVVQPSTRQPSYLGKLRREFLLKLASWKAALWLALKQSKWLAIGLGVAGIVAGLVFLIPDAQPAMAWPQWSLCMGVLAGVLAFGEEQTKGVARFWAERRLPLGRFWLVKLAVYFTIALLACTISFVIALIGHPQNPLHSSIFIVIAPHGFMFMFLGLVYGFAFGHFCSLFFRKSIVTSLVAIILGATFAGLLLPSIINGGVERWQIWGIPCLLLLLSRCLLYPWANGRILQRGPLKRAIAGLSGLILLTAGSIGYRIIQIPYEPDHLVASGFKGSIPLFDDNKAGQLFRGAVSQYQQASKESSSLLPTQKQDGPAAQEVVKRNSNFLLFLRVMNEGWTDESNELKPWLDEVFSKAWMGVLKEAADQPMGVVEDPQTIDRVMVRDILGGTQELVNAVSVRGLQRQAEGHPKEYIELLRQTLSLIRSLKNKGDSESFHVAMQSEYRLLGALPVWMKQVNQADLFIQALAVLEEHDRLCPNTADEVFWADQIILRNTFQNISNWLPPYLRGFRVPPRNAETESEVITFAWNVPWETERQERILRRVSNPENSVGRGLVSQLLLMPPLDINKTSIEQRSRNASSATFLLPGTKSLQDSENNSRANRRMHLLAIALRAYEAKKGSLPATLNELVPDYLTSVPLDPYSEKPFGYRISQGESIVMPSLQNKDEAKKLKHFDIEDLPMLEMVIGLASTHSGLPLFPLWKMHESYDPRAWSGGLSLQPALPPYVMVEGGIGSMPPGGGEEPKVAVRAGQAVLWSVGRDGKDDGGRRGATSGGSVTNRGEDWIIIVPSQPASPGPKR